MSINNFVDELDLLIRSRYPVIYLISFEEEKVDKIINSVAFSSKNTQRKSLYVWSVTQGITDVTAGTKISSNTTDPLEALSFIEKCDAPAAIFLFKDFHPYLSDSSIIRKVREIAQSLVNSYKTLIFVSPILKIPQELEKEIAVLDVPLPTLKELESKLDELTLEVNKTGLRINLASDDKESILQAALGLTLKEAENIFSKALVSNGYLTKDDLRLILSEKKQIVRKSGILEYNEAQENFNDVGGLNIFKEWIVKRKKIFSESAKEFGLPFPKGVLLLGVQGCGKSLCAKATSALFEQPLLRFDLGKVFSSLVGSSEENIRKGIQIAETVSPAVLWIDEIEKAFSGVASSNLSDAGTTSRVFATFLTWLQEKQSSVFVIATANDIKILPPELMRKGRFDEIFFVDLPNFEERMEILKIHLTKRKQDINKFNLENLCKLLEDFSGAEIEQLIISAMYDAFYENKKTLSEELIIKNIKDTFPLSKTMEEDIKVLRNWAKGRTRFASSVDRKNGLVFETSRKLEMK